MAGVKKMDPVARLRKTFEMKIHKDSATECWNWTGGRDKRGYPRIRFGVRVLYAYRAGVFLYGNPKKVPLESKVRMRISCGNQLCVNPKHVWVGEDE